MATQEEFIVPAHDIPVLERFDLSDDDWWDISSSLRERLAEVFQGEIEAAKVKADLTAIQAIAADRLAEIARLTKLIHIAQGGLQWLLDDMHDAGETHVPADLSRAPDFHGVIFDSVEHAAAALIDIGGVGVGWYTPEQAAAYREKCAKEDAVKS